MMQYDFKAIEQKWQQFWQENQTFKACNQSNKEKFYSLDMFPYPSGAGLHVGHPLGYIASDIISRYQRHLNKNVLHPIGFDSFGLPAEQYAIDTGKHPAETTKININRYKLQLKKLGFSFDWSREFKTSDPEYYRWTQWIFIQLFNHYYCLKSNQAKPIQELIESFDAEGNSKVEAENSQEEVFTAEEWKKFSEKEQSKILLNYRLTYLAEAEVNWCPALGTVLANDEVENGVSERGGYPVVRKKMTQWMMRIKAYANRLLLDLNDLDWPEPLKELQRNWIGKSQGANVFFPIENSEKKIEVFTTRPDTIFGVSFMVLAPEYEWVKEITTQNQSKEINAYIEKSAQKSERERISEVKAISGAFTGAYAIHPFTNQQIPIWISDYVLASYGTGAVMAVPAGDQRDYDFAKHFGLEIPAIFNQEISEQAFSAKEGFQLINSYFLNGLDYKNGLPKVLKKLEEENIGYGSTNFRLRDAVFSRQRYWGEPVPIYFKNGTPQPIPIQCLPLELPEIHKYLPTKTGEPPLGRAEKWAWDEKTQKVVENDLIDEKTIFPIELNTMPGWAGSSWYFNRYMDSENSKEFASSNALNYWKEIDLYIGGSEHATGHLLYARFWQKFLFDLDFVPVKEFAKKLINQGMILGNSAFIYRNEANNFVSSNLETDGLRRVRVDISYVNEEDQSLDIQAFKNSKEDLKDVNFQTNSDGKFFVEREVEKMSKSKYNVLNPDEICESFGADTLRMYEMFLGPLEQSKPWNTQGLNGVHSFLKKFYRLFDQETLIDLEPSKEEWKILHQAIKKITEDIEKQSLNTCVSQFMIAVNSLQKRKNQNKKILSPLCILLSPFAPHLAEELWQKLGNTTSISNVKWPTFEAQYLVENQKDYPVSFNGKMRFKLSLSLDLSKEEIQHIVLKEEQTLKYLDGKVPKKVIIVPGKIINFVV